MNFYWQVSYVRYKLRKGLYIKANYSNQVLYHNISGKLTHFGEIYVKEYICQSTQFKIGSPVLHLQEGWIFLPIVQLQLCSESVYDFLSGDLWFSVLHALQHLQHLGLGGILSFSRPPQLHQIISLSERDIIFEYLICLPSPCWFCTQSCVP